MFGRMMSCCVALLLTFSSVSAVRKLNSITHLRSVGSDISAQEDCLCFLHWFANTVDINTNDDIRLTFSPNHRDYGSHQYHNREQLLDALPRGYQYYSLGNIHREGSLQLPDHVIQSEHQDGNRARIIIIIRQQNMRRQTSRIIDRVYVTQHYEAAERRGRAYDPQHTYEITTDLLRAIRRFPMDSDDINLLRSLRNRYRSDADDFQLSEIRNEWGHLACLGLLVFIVIQHTSA